MAIKIRLADINVDGFIMTKDHFMSSIEFKSLNVDLNNNSTKQTVALRYDNKIDVGDIIKFGTSYFNHDCTIELPEDMEMMMVKDAPKQSSYYNVNSDFIYEAHDYNDFVQTKDERQIPTVYLSLENQYNTKEYQRYNPFNKSVVKNKILKFQTKLQETYTAASQDTLSRYSKMFFGVNFPFGIVGSNISSFPWYNKISFSANSKQRILNELNTEQVGLYDKVILDYENYNIISKDYMVGNTPTSIPVVDMFDLLELAQYGYPDEGLSVHLPNLDPLSTIAEASSKWTAIANLKPAALAVCQKYKNIFYGEDCTHEYMFFKIQKFVGDETTGTPFQEFTVANLDDNVLFFDTQVKPLESYTYVVKAYVMVHGIKYSYELLHELDDGNSKTAHISINGTPSMKIFEVPYFQKRVFVSRKPPLMPFVKFINKSNSKNKIKIFLNLQRGEAVSTFKPVLSSDSQLIQYMQPKLIGDHEFVEFEYSEQPGRFQVFKSNKKINKYEFDAHWTVINNKGASYAVIDQVLVANRKYYYFFRTIDNHDLPSNPTPIYEVELQKDADNSKIIVKTIPIVKDEDNYFDPDVKFKEFLHIYPAFLQTQLKQPPNFDFSTYKQRLPHFGLGEAVESLWGRKFKFRVTSNDTGRKIDFNLIFDITKAESEENLE